MAWPAVGAVGADEAFAASQPATGGRSTRHDRRWFGRLEQEDQRLKKHYGRWMDIVRSLELESFILTKLTKPSVPVNLVGPQVSLPLYWSQLAGGVFIFFVRNKEALPCVRRYSWWVRAVSGGNVFFAKYRGPFGGSLMSGGGIIILRVIRRHFLACGRGPSCRPLHVKSTLDACRSLTTLTRPRREHQGGGRRRGLGKERHGGREDSTVVFHAEGSTTVRGFTGSSAVAGE